MRGALDGERLDPDVVDVPGSPERPTHRGRSDHRRSPHPRETHRRADATPGRSLHPSVDLSEQGVLMTMIDGMSLQREFTTLKLRNQLLTMSDRMYQLFYKGVRENWPQTTLVRQACERMTWFSVHKSSLKHRDSNVNMLIHFKPCHAFFSSKLSFAFDLRRKRARVGHTKNSAYLFSGKRVTNSSW